MIAVIFEVEPDEQYKELYLDIAADLKPQLEQIEGFISVERFQSLTNPGKILSLSFFEDEEAVKNWRNLPSHRKAQEVGRKKALNRYRLRVAQVLRDYGKLERDDAPEDSRAFHSDLA